jgi:hypothetical protein
MSMDMVEFLTARLRDDEKAALAANHDGPWSTPGDDGIAEGMLYAHDAPGSDNGWMIAQFKMYPNGIANQSSEPGYLPAFPTMPIHHIENAVHAARHDPARVLRDVEAKRRIMTFADRRPELGEGRYVGEGVIRLLASVYADHPDYREEWRP